MSENRHGGFVMNRVTFGLLSGERYTDGELDDGDAEDEQLLLEVRLLDGGGTKLVARESDGDGGYRDIMRADRSRTFFTSRQHIGEIGNKIRDSATLPPGVDGDDVKDGFEDACRWLDRMADEAESETETAMRPPAVEQVLDDTERVAAFNGDPTVFTITLARNGRRTELELTQNELITGGRNKLIGCYAGNFYERPEITKEDWGTITDAWLAQTEETGEETQTEMDTVVDAVVRHVSRTITVVGETEDYKTGTHAAFYDVGNSTADADVAEHPEGGPDADVIWVKSAVITEGLKESGKSSGIIGELSKKLQESDAVYNGSKKKLGEGSAYPFDPEAVGKTRDSIPDDDPEVTV